ncbi:MFS transporter [Aquimarina sp. W85]|uniref:MFS transporter n=1 Tax=Aquimarina rhodophyticola TaxID=3342246 RepID=UPI00366F5550
MHLKLYLLGMTLVAVISDYLLHPFYPHFFEARFGVKDPRQVGYYFAAICFMVMIAFPCWAYLSKYVHELRILVITQCIAGILALCCFYTDNYFTFWIISLTMILFKGSYLLVYPLILKHTSKTEHTKTIGLLSVIVHLGGIVGALMGGLTVDLIHASYIFIIMAAGDFVQMGVSAVLLAKYNKKLLVEKDASNNEVSSSTYARNSFIIKIGLITLLLYFSDFLIRPFFVAYWELTTSYDNTILSGFMYSIPGIVAFLILVVRFKDADTKGFNGILTPLLLGAIGLILQGIPSPVSVVIGRIVYGYALFYSVVRFDVLLFKLSDETSYATDYSKVHFFQNLGVLIASFTVGILVEQQGVQLPFLVAFFGFLMTLGLYIVFFGSHLKKKRNSQITIQN